LLVAGWDSSEVAIHPLVDGLPVGSPTFVPCSQACWIA
jgi:hypothetical protein